MQEFISFLKYLATSNTINFIIMIAILMLIVKKVNVKSSLDNSVASVKQLIVKSDEEKKKSEALLSEAKKKMDKLPEDIKTLEREASSKADVFKAQIEESTQKSIWNIEKNVDIVISIEEKKLSNLLTGKTIIASVELAKDHIKNILRNNPQLHNKFIDESLEELEKVKL